MGISAGAAFEAIHVASKVISQLVPILLMPEGKTPEDMLHSLRVDILCGIVHNLVLNLILASAVEEKEIDMDDELQSLYEDMGYCVSGLMLL